MVVQHNLTAMNSNRMLGLTTATQAKSTEKLSSGYKINRAADDAAGLSISEKMRKQIRGLTQASLNAQDGISAVQTAEGALTEVHDMLQRMNELAVKAANGTNSVDDREYIQNEIDQLVTEIDRVAETTKFNETYLLKGNTTAAKEYTAVYATAEVEASVEVTGGTDLYAAGGDAALSEEEILTALENGDTLYTTADADQTVSSATYTAAKLNFGSGNMWAEVSGSRTKVDATNMATYFDVADDGTVSVKTGVTLHDAATAGNDITDTQSIVTGSAEGWSGVTGATLYAENGTEALSEDAAKAALKAGDTLYTNAKAAQTEAVDGVDYDYTEAATPALYDVNGNKISENGLDSYLDIAEDGTATLKADKTLYTDDKGTTKLLAADIATYVTTEQTKVASLDLDLHVGADATQNNQIAMEIETMSAAGIGVDGLKVDGADDSNALDAIETIKAAIQKVSTQRSALGAIQNRLEHTINNLDNVVENTTAAESQIRDTDMATEMVKYSNNNILAQAGQAMLAQANQSNQGVLSLLG